MSQILTWLYHNKGLTVVCRDECVECGEGIVWRDYYPKGGKLHPAKGDIKRGRRFRRCAPCAAAAWAREQRAVGEVA